MRGTMVLVFLAAVLAGCGGSGSNAGGADGTTTAVERTTTTAVTGACVDSFSKYGDPTTQTDYSDYLPTLVDCDTVAEWAAAAEAVKAPIPLADPAETLVQICQTAASADYLSDGICGEAIRGT